MRTEHRDVLQHERVESARMLHLHRNSLDRRSTARSVLASERARTRRARTQYVRELAAARVDAHRARLFQFLERRLKRAA
jgi:hypothetical protein